MSNPVKIFWGSISLSALLILSDYKSGVSLDLPGRGRLGFSALIAGVGSVIYFLSKGGLQALTAEIAGGLFGAIIIAAVLAFLLRDR